MLRKIADECMLIPTGMAAQNFNGMMTLNETAEFIWNHIDDAANREHLVELVVESYDVEQEAAQKDVCGLVDAMIRLGMIAENEDRVF